MSRFAPIVVGVLLLVACTVFQGLWTRRWSDETTQELRELVNRYDSIPTNVGDLWVGEDTGGHSQQVLDVAGAYKSVSRVYRNVETNETVSIFLVCGYSRDIAVHTPDACYVSNGFKMAHKPKDYKIRSASVTSKTLTSTFRKERGGSLIHQRILWCWTNGKGWEAPANPRITYGGGSVINKIYLISNISGDEHRDLDTDPAVEFGKIFLPITQEVLYPVAPADTPTKVATN